MGAAGREHVRTHFLITRYLCDHLRMFNVLAGVEGEQASGAPQPMRPARGGDATESR